MSEPEKNAFALYDLQFVNWFPGTPRFSKMHSTIKAESAARSALRRGYDRAYRSRALSDAWFRIGKKSRADSARREPRQSLNHPVPFAV